MENDVWASLYLDINWFEKILCFPTWSAPDGFGKIGFQKLQQQKDLLSVVNAYREE